MSAFASNLNFGLRISAKDDTAGGISSALSGLKRITTAVAKPITIPVKVAGAGLGILRDINLGLRPALAGINAFAERGGRLIEVQRAFGTLTRANAAQLDVLGRKLVDAATGDLRMADAMATANKALAGGLAFRDLPTLFEFGAKRAAAFGESAEGAIGRLADAIHRGSFRSLKELGIDIGDIADDFESMQAGGKFTQLEFAQKKAQVLAVMISRMRADMEKFGITGSEAGSDREEMINQVHDMVDELHKAVVASKAFGEVLKGSLDITSGLTQHFKGGGGFTELLFGKPGGTGNGLAGIAGSFMLDLGEMGGRGLISGIAKSLSSTPDLLGEFFDDAENRTKGILNLVDGKIDKWTAQIKGLIPSGFGNLFGGSPTSQPATTQPATSLIGRASGTVEVLTDIAKAGGSAMVKGTPGVVATDMLQHSGVRAIQGVASKASAQVAVEDAAARALRDLRAGSLGRPPPGGAWFQSGILGGLGRGALKASAKYALPAFTIADFLITTANAVKETISLFGAMGDLKQAEDTLRRAKEMSHAGRPATEGTGVGWGFGIGRKGRNALQRLADAAENATPFARTRASVAGFGSDFGDIASLKSATETGNLPGGLTLTPEGFSRRAREVTLLERQLRPIEAQAHRDARRMVSEQARELRRSGILMPAQDQEEARRKIAEDLISRRGASQRTRLSQLDQEISGSRIVSGEGPSRIAQELGKLGEKMKDQIGIGKDQLNALRGLGQGLQKIAQEIFGTTVDLGRLQ